MSFEAFPTRALLQIILTFRGSAQAHLPTPLLGLPRAVPLHPSTAVPSGSPAPDSVPSSVPPTLLGLGHLCVSPAAELCWRPINFLSLLDWLPFEPRVLSD